MSFDFLKKKKKKLKTIYYLKQKLIFSLRPTKPGPKNVMGYIFFKYIVLFN
jgi:hypothetical protein